MLMFSLQRWYHHNLQSTDCLTVLAIGIGIVAILVHYQPSYTKKASDPLLNADVTLSCRMYPHSVRRLKYPLTKKGQRKF
jgi:hypothetical protein